MEEKLENLKLLIESVKDHNTGSALEILAVIIVIALCQALFGSYLKKKFQYLATTENFEQLKIQLSENTKVVEEVKANVQSELWLSQQVWTKKHESYETILTFVFKMKGLLKDRLNQNTQWLKDITKENESYDLDAKYKELIEFSSLQKESTFTNKLELLEESIISKSVFLISEFHSIELEISKISSEFIEFEDSLLSNEAHENVIKKISSILNRKISTLEKAINDIKSISSKDLMINKSKE